MTALTRLRSLGLKWATHPGSDYAVLTALGSLRQLALSSCAHLPDCLPQLTGLEALTIQDPLGCREDFDEDVVASIE